MFLSRLSWIPLLPFECWSLGELSLPGLIISCELVCRHYSTLKFAEFWIFQQDFSSIPECKHQISVVLDLSKTSNLPSLFLQNEGQHCISHSSNQGHSISVSLAISLLSYTAQNLKLLWFETLLLLYIGVHLGLRWSSQCCLLPSCNQSLCKMMQLPASQNHYQIQCQMLMLVLYLQTWLKMKLKWIYKCRGVIK